MIDLVVKLIIGSGALAIIYRLYLAFSQHLESNIEHKNSETVSNDMQKIIDDKEAIKESDKAFNDAVSEFEKNGR